eukprot:2524771-Pleurochrysis_carterae.AAC.4
MFSHLIRLWHALDTALSETSPRILRELSENSPRSIRESSLAFILTHILPVTSPAFSSCFSPFLVPFSVSSAVLWAGAAYLAQLTVPARTNDPPSRSTGFVNSCNARTCLPLRVVPTFVLFCFCLTCFSQCNPRFREALGRSSALYFLNWDHASVQLSNTPAKRSYIRGQSLLSQPLPRDRFPIGAAESEARRHYASGSSPRDAPPDYATSPRARVMLDAS